MSTSKEQAVYNYWSSFGVPAYLENSVPDDAVTPYITYELATDNFDHNLALSGNIWSRSTSWSEANTLLKAISKTLSNGGKIGHFDDGAMWITKGSPFAQRMGDESDNSVKRILLNIDIEFMSED